MLTHRFHPTTYNAPPVAPLDDLHALVVAARAGGSLLRKQALGCDHKSNGLGVLVRGTLLPR
jgi:hypothetical protein